MYIVISPLKTEISHFLKNAGLKKAYKKKGLNIYRGIFSGREILLAVTGMGRKSSIRSIKGLFSYLKENKIGNSSIERIILTGFCGSLTDEIKIGDIVIYKQLINLEKKNRQGSFYRSASITFDTGFLEKMLAVKNRPIIYKAIGATVPNVIGKASRKKRLAKDHHCRVIDIESYWIAKNINMPKYLLIARAVSDDTANDFPEGRFLASKIIFSVFKPKSSSNLFNILENMEKAKKSISFFLVEILKL